MKLDLFSILWNLASLVVTVALHSVGTVLIVAERQGLFRFASRQRKVIRGQFVITIIVIELLILHLIEIGFWGFACVPSDYFQVIAALCTSQEFPRRVSVTAGISRPLV